MRSERAKVVRAGRRGREKRVSSRYCFDGRKVWDDALEGVHVVSMHSIVWSVSRCSSSALAGAMAFVTDAEGRRRDVGGEKAQCEVPLMTREGQRRTVARMFCQLAKHDILWTMQVESSTRLTTLR